MITPTLWFIFISQMDLAVDEAGSFEAAVQSLKAGTTAAEQEELLDFFERAQTVTNSECGVLEMATTGEKVYLEFPDGECRSFYKYVSEIFKEDHVIDRPI